MIREQRTFSKTLFKPGEFEKRRLYVLVWTQNILKKELSENDDITIVQIAFLKILIRIPPA